MVLNEETPNESRVGRPYRRVVDGRPTRDSFGAFLVSGPMSLTTNIVLWSPNYAV